MRAAVTAALVWALVPAAPAATVAQRIDRLLDSSAAVRSAFWGIHVVNLATGRTLYQRNPHRLFVPASNTKLFTAALALDRLGPSFTFHTRVWGAAPDGGGVVRGGLRLAGGGDPNLSGRTLPYAMGAPAGNPLAGIEDLAAQVAGRGVRRVEGGIAGDDTWYPFEPFPEGWSISDPNYDYGAPVSALAVNDNVTSLEIRPGAREGDPAALLLHPPFEYYTVDNRVRTGRAGSARSLHLERAPGSFEVRLSGSIALRDPGEERSLAVDDPALFAAMALTRALEARGITVAGGISAAHRAPGDPEEPPAGIELAHRQSAPLVECLRVLAKVSQNLHAEMALRAVARARRNQGTLEAGLDEMGAFLAEAGIEPTAYNFEDGSGLSRPNLVTPAAVVALLSHMYRSPARENWISLLPVGGLDGTLSARFGEGPAAGRVRAKTGSLAHVAALSGYLQRPRGGWLAFSILVNNFQGPAAEVRGAMDRICTLLLE